MGARLQYNRLLKGCLDNSYKYADVPPRYQTQVKAYADADLASGVLPQWQYDLMGFPVD